MRARMGTVLLVAALVAGACASAGEEPTAGGIHSVPTTTDAGVASAPTTTSPPATTTTSTTTTTTTTTTTKTTTKATTTTTTAGSPGITQPPSQPPEVSITSPANLATFQASYSTGDGLFGAEVTFVAEVSDPEGDSVEVEWYSSDEGYLGTGLAITVRIHTLGSDSAQPFITARATDTTGAVGADSIQIIVFIPSDQG